jgi:hypothetical protein
LPLPEKTARKDGGGWRPLPPLMTGVKDDVAGEVEKRGGTAVCIMPGARAMGWKGVLVRLQTCRRRR